MSISKDRKYTKQTLENIKKIHNLIDEIEESGELFSLYKFRRMYLRRYHEYVSPTAIKVPEVISRIKQSKNYHLNVHTCKRRSAIDNGMKIKQERLEAEKRVARLRYHLETSLKEEQNTSSIPIGRLRVKETGKLCESGPEFNPWDNMNDYEFWTGAKWLTLGV